MTRARRAELAGERPRMPVCTHLAGLPGVGAALAANHPNRGQGDSCQEWWGAGGNVAAGRPLHPALQRGGIAMSARQSVLRRVVS